VSNQGQWLAVDDQPRVWFALGELQASPYAPPKPFREWTADHHFNLWGCRRFLIAFKRRRSSDFVTTSPFHVIVDSRSTAISITSRSEARGELDGLLVAIPNNENTPIIPSTVSKPDILASDATNMPLISTPACVSGSLAPPSTHKDHNGTGVMRNSEQWLCVDDEPRMWFARHELESAPRAPAAPFETWSYTETLAAMISAIERRAGLMEVTTARQ
jgi:hypothetical protein